MEPRLDELRDGRARNQGAPIRAQRNSREVGLAREVDRGLAGFDPALHESLESLLLRVGPTLNLLFPQYCGSLEGHDWHRVAIDALHRRDGQALAQAIRDDLTHGARYLVRLLKP